MELGTTREGMGGKERKGMTYDEGSERVDDIEGKLSVTRGKRPADSGH